MTALPERLRAAALPMIQLLLVAGSFLFLALMPPVRGEMLLVPLHGGVSAQRLAFESGAVVLGLGRYGGVVVRGDRAELARRLLRAGVLPLAAPRLLCGEVTPR